MGIHYLSYFCSKHRLWVRVRTASPRRFLRVPTIYVLSRNMKNIGIFYQKFFIFGGKIFNIFEKACFLNAMYILTFKPNEDSFKLRQTCTDIPNAFRIHHFQHC